MISGELQSGAYGLDCEYDMHTADRLLLSVIFLFTLQNDAIMEGAAVLTQQL